ncbi:MAG TPA: hypothetical protein VI789_07595 [Dehalococcoidia bacterium]|nr:hypothetical protein [Dehalococcoidia bacterium]
MKKVSEMTEAELKELIIAAMDEALLGFFGDPDEGLQLSAELEKQLRKSMKRVERGERGYSLEEVKERLHRRVQDGV